MRPFRSSNELAFRPAVSIIIPVYREAATIGGALAALPAAGLAQTDEVIVVDGDCQGRTLSRIDDPGVRQRVAARGRAVQMNDGAAVAGKEVLLFLHADTRLPNGALDRIGEAVIRGADAGAFTLGIDSDRPAFRLIERAVRLRTRLTRIPSGDQAAFVRRAVFEAIGGFREIPIMEDVDLGRRLVRAGRPPVILAERAATSARRWEREGLVRCTLRNWALITLYLAGVPPHRLARYYWILDL
jgi:rSAM/selenodomain-associated transferase 2